MLLLGWAVGSGSTTVDTWFSQSVREVVGENPRWLLAFTSWWLTAAVLLAGLAVAVYRRRRRLAIAVLLCPLAVILATAGLKRLFNRRNGPYLEYPSGHTGLLVAVLGMLVVVVTARALTVAAAVAVSLLGMLGLIACGYHYLTDTIGAALLASALVCAAAEWVGRAGRAGATAGRSGAAVVVLCAIGCGAAGVSSAAPTDPGTAGFVDVHSVLPSAIIDLRYATANNFLRTPLYPAGARCLVHESLAPGLVAAADALRGRGRTLVFWDCYRPHDVQVRMFEAVPDPTWVARPGPFARSHVAGRSVDVTIADPNRRLVDMGTDFDDFSPRAGSFSTGGISAAAAENRSVLRDAMRAGGFAPYSGEWWHFDGPGAGVERPIVDVPLS